MSHATHLLHRFEKAHAEAHRSAARSPPGHPKPESLGERFHEIWPKAAPVLGTLLKVSGLIPGLSNAAPVLSGLIAIGNALAGEEAA